MKFLGVLLLIALAYAKHEKYIGYKSYFIELTSDLEFQAFGPMINKYELDVLSNPIRGREGVVLVKPEHQEGLLKELEAASIQHRIHIDDVKRALDVDDERIEAYSNATRARGARQIPYNNYQRLDVIYDYIDSIGEQYPDLVTVVTPANSFEGRPIKYLKISTTNFEDHSKPVIFIDGGIHSREWLSPPTVTWAIHKLVEDNTDRELLDRFDWILLPMVNPDGYEYSHVSERFWRKTRSTEMGTGSCAGTDGNRNYDFFWNTVGTDPNPCAETYAGSRAFSEIETRVVRDILHEHLNRMALYLTMHSFGSMILYPWGHDGSLSANALGLHTVGIAMADAIHTHRLPNFPLYIVGNSALVLWYGAAGAAEDYAHSIGVPLSYTYELPGLDWGYWGFHLNPIYIEHVCRETWDGIVVGAKRAGDLWARKMIQ